MIEGLIRLCLPIPQKTYPITKRLKTLEEVEKYFPGFLAFTDSTEQQIPRPIDKRRRTVYYSGKKKKHTIKTQLMVNNHGFVIHKLGYKKGSRGMIMISIKRIIQSLPKMLLMYLTLDTL